jgi:hypothetical protein
MAQDPASDMTASHAYDLVAFRGGSVSNEMEADMIRGVLDANGIPSLMVAGPEFPNLGFDVRVPRGLAAEAERVIAEAQAAGPEAATEAEAETER